MRKTLLFLCLAMVANTFGQATGTNQGVNDKQEQERLGREAEARRKELLEAERDGIEVRVKEIARFRGIRANQLLGVGLVVGLSGTGDTKNTPYSQTLLANAMREFGFAADAPQLKVKNIAVVFVTCELPPFAAPGNSIDVTVQSMGDAKSLQGGELLQTPLYAGGNRERAYVVAQGPVSIGGFQVQAAGNLSQKNHPTVGKSPGIVESKVPTKTVFDGRMFLELDDADITTAKRVAHTIGNKFPEYVPRAVDGGSIELLLPEGKNSVDAMAEIEQVRVFSDSAGTVVIDERTGTIIMGGNVRIGPAVIAKGGLSVRIEQVPLVSQPAPFSNGTTTTATQTNVGVEEETAQVATVLPNATVGDLALIFQKLKVSPSDIIAILENLRVQGALKAKLKRV